MSIMAPPKRKTAYGIIGIKVWIFKGEIMEHDPLGVRAPCFGSLRWWWRSSPRLRVLGLAWSPEFGG
jgi:hypothetical protein